MIGAQFRESMADISRYLDNLRAFTGPQRPALTDDDLDGRMRLHAAATGARAALDATDEAVLPSLHDFLRAH